ncbi:MAG: DUF2065 domain-containing protein [Desulfofustis sp. PB-SRB1]|jgi:uncharacterized protein YjeT (DUF2065 family)|nr:DUF2065 domain-containing protein [Desulfofustis sp. PB-SRB1]MBM1002235.1 DUF2065 domain-containing protein [Desulfofustis sp. PB-SRB1]HBH31609.1 DUF2065 domain-containing protein [Desulfofustis sp.]
MKLLLLVFGMVLVVEGLPYAAAPEKMRQWLLQLTTVDPKTLRIMGFVSMAAGIFICWLVQQSSLFS